MERGDASEWAQPTAATSAGQAAVHRPLPHVRRPATSPPHDRHRCRQPPQRAKPPRRPPRTGGTHGPANPPQHPAVVLRSHFNLVGAPRHRDGGRARSHRSCGDPGQRRGPGQRRHRSAKPIESINYSGFNSATGRPDAAPAVQQQSQTSRYDGGPEEGTRGATSVQRQTGPARATTAAPKRAPAEQPRSSRRRRPARATTAAPKRAPAVPSSSSSRSAPAVRG